MKYLNIYLKKKYNIDFVFITGILFLFPINISLVGSVRPVDILILLFFMYRIFSKNKYYNKDAIFLVLVFLVLMILSILFGLFFRSITSLGYIFFLVKYSMPFILFFSIKNSDLTENELRRLVYIFGVVYLLMLSWTILYQPLRFLGFIKGSWRTAFPFTKPPESDAHMLSAYFSFHIILMIFAWRKGILNWKVWRFFLIISLSLMAMLITGSRNGILSLLVAYIPLEYYCSSGKMFTYKKKELVVFFLMLIVSLGGLYLLLRINNQLFTERFGIKDLVSRAFSFNFSHDLSVNGRQDKLQYAISEVFNGPSLIGIGALTSKMGWFDGIIPSVLVNSGVLGFLVLSILIFFVLIKNRKKAILNDNKVYYQIYLLVIVDYIISNLATEFILVTRGMVFSIFVFAMIEKIINIKSFKLADI